MNITACDLAQEARWFLKYCHESAAPSYAARRYLDNMDAGPDAAAAGTYTSEFDIFEVLRWNGLDYMMREADEIFGEVSEDTIAEALERDLASALWFARYKLEQLGYEDDENEEDER